jgi:chemotaxis protein CheZ
VSNESGDSEELEALFDSIVAASGPAESEIVDAEVVHEEKRPVSQPADMGDGTVFSQIGHLTRKLHDTLRELGYDKTLEKAVEAIPDTRDRLDYIAKMTEKAAVRALTATEIAQPIQEKLEARSNELAGQWQKVFDNQLGVEEFKQLAAQTRDFLKDIPNQTKATNAQLMEIMMAQDFQDLTGQVIKKTLAMAQSMEHDMLQLLIAVTPLEKKVEVDASLLNGPVINADGRSDVVTSQQQVDDLLESLGF